MSALVRLFQSAALPACPPGSVRAERARPSVPAYPPRRRSQIVAQEQLPQPSVLDFSSCLLAGAHGTTPCRAGSPFALGPLSYPIRLDEAVACRVAQYGVSTAWLGKAGA